MNLMKQILLSVGLLLASVAVWGQTKSFQVDEPGTLNQVIPGDEKYTLTDIKISGKINGSDMVVIRDMAGRDRKSAATEGKLTRLDLSEADIVSGGASYFESLEGDLYATDNTIGESMFDLCDRLTYINLPKSVKKIDKAAFSGCTALDEIVMHEGLEELGEAAFVACGFPEITIPEGVVELPDLLFYFCDNLTKVRFPKSLSKIGKEIFSECFSIKDIEIAEGNQSFVVDDGVLYDSNKSSLLYYIVNRPGSDFTLPASVKTIADGAFANTTLNMVTLNEGLTAIGEFAFDGSSLSSLTLPSTVRGVGKYAFNNCSSLKEVSLEASLDSLSESMFSQCRVLGSLNIPSNIKTIGMMAFSGCKGLRSVTLPDRLQVVKDMAFANCKALENVKIPSSVTSFGKGLFYGCTGLQECILPQNMTEIPYQMFYGCTSLKAIEIPQTVKYIMHYAFQNSGLTKLSIPRSVVSITDGAFSGCKDIAEIHNYNPVPQPLGMIPVFFMLNADIPLYVPFGCKSAYEEAGGWNEFLNIIEMQEHETDPAGIGNTADTGSEIVREVDFHDLNGNRVTKDHRGLTIVRMSNGDVRKVMTR